MKLSGDAINKIQQIAENRNKTESGVSGRRLTDSDREAIRERVQSAADKKAQGETYHSSWYGQSINGRVDQLVSERTKALQGNNGGSIPGSYYSRPNFGERGDELYRNAEGIQLTLAGKSAAVNRAKESLTQRQNDLRTVMGYLDQARSAYQENPSEENAEYYNSVAGAYSLAYRSYEIAYGVYSAAYDSYKPYEDRLVNALVDYRVYMNQQQNAYNDWRSTIRDSEIVKADLDAVNAQIAELEKQERAQRNAQYSAANYQGGVQGPTMMTSSQYGPGARTEPTTENDISPQMQELLNRRALLQEEYGWSQYFPYADLANAPDFKEKSKYVSTANGQERSAIDIMMGNYSGGAPWDDPLYEYVNGNEEAGAYISNAAASSYGDNAIGSAFGRATESKTESQQMKPQEVATFNYIYATQGKEAAHQYYSYLQSDLNYRQRKEDEKYWGGYAAENHAKASLLSWVLSPTKGLSYLGQAADYMTGGKIDQNAGYNKYSYAGSTMRGQVANQIENGKWGKWGSFGYQTAMSMADFLLNTAITGGNQTVTLAIMGTGAAADATIDAKDRGLTDDQAFALGTIAGLAEVITEKVSLETLLNPDLLKNGALKYVLKNMLAEGSEEVGSDVINLFADVLIAKDQSEWHKSMDAYIAEGKTPNEAFGLAAADQAAEMGLDFLGGFLSGGFMSGGNAAIHVNFTGKLGKELGNLNLSEEDVKAFIETGLDSAPETASYQIAQELQKKLDAGKKLSNYDISRLYQANIQAVEEENKGNAQPGDTATGNERGAQNGAESNGQPEGLSLSALEDARTNQSDQVAGQQGAQRNAPISVAERLRQGQNQNGGIHNARTSEQGQQLTAGADILDGIQGRYASPGTAEQAGVLEAGTVQQGNNATVDQRRAIVARQNLARHLRLEKTSSQELGLQNGTEAKTIQVMPQEQWDGEMKKLADRLYNETGKNVVFVLGRIQVRGAGGNVGYVRGVFSGDRIILQADNLRVPMEKIADHEAYHAKVDFAAKADLNREIKKHITSTFSKEQFKKVLDKYIITLRGVYNVADATSPEEFAHVMKLIEEEIFADAYAGINAFDAHADQFTEAVNEKMDQLMMGKQNQENGTKQETGPPAETGTKEETGKTEDRYSYEETRQEGERELRGLSLPTLYDRLRTQESTESRERYSAEEQELEGLSLPTLDEIGKVNTIQDNVRAAEDNSIRDEYFKGRISTETIEEDIQKVARMDPVAQISGTEFEKGEKKLITQVTEFFNDLGNRAYNPQLGSVMLDRKGAKSDLGHGMGRKKAASFAAVPDVLARGYVVDYQENWKGRGYDTAVVAAPVQIGDEECLMGIVLNRNSPKNRFYVHEVLTTEDEASPFKTGTREGDPSGNAPSVISILKKIQDVKKGTSDSERNATRERFSMDDAQQQAGTEEELDPEKLEEQWKEEHKKDKETWLKEQLGEEGYKVYQEQKRKKAQERGKKKPEIPKSRPVTAKRQLRQTVLNLFSIPGGQRAELGTMIDNYADRLIKNGTLTEEDRKAFFDRMYEAGVMTVPANDYYAEARSYMKGGRIYVPDYVVTELGDDWNGIRRRAFAAGIYITRSRMHNGVQNAGIDVWNNDLASELPGLFDSEDTDQRSILERIIQVAEEGMDEKMSLPEYTAWLAETEHQSEDEFLDNMERQMDYALRAFAEKADLEVKLRDKSERMLAAEREARKEAAERATQRKQLQELQQKTLKQLQWLSKNRNRAPEELRTAWDEVLGDIDIYAVSAANEMMWSDKYNATWRDLAQMYKDAQKSDPNFLPSDDLRKIVDRLDKEKIGDMDIDALNDLYKAAIGLRTEFYNRNNVINDEQKRLFAEVYADSKREIEAAPGKYTGNPMDKLFNLEQLTPMNVLQRMGGWDPDGAFYSMAKQLERGERDIRAYKVKAQRMLQDFLTEHEDWVKKADGQGKDGIWYEIEVPELLELGMGDKPIFGDTVKVYMTPAQKVHMYLESKSYDNLRHMTGGRTFADKALYSDGKRQEAFAQGKTIRLAPETVKKLVSNLTAEEMELAKVLEQYYNTFATKEINKVSNVLYGYDKAMGKNYAPIYTNRNYTKAEFGVFDQTAEGVGNLKGRIKSKNPSYNISALDAFERHVDQTARFCGMAIPARNWTTFMNWQERNNSTGDVITHKWGDEGKKYITDLITRLQSGEKVDGDSVSSWIEKLKSNYIAATFGANPSIVLKQLGSIPLAAVYLDAKNLPSLAQMRNIDRTLIAKYTQDLEWRTMGYSMPETKFLKDNPNWARSNKVFGFVIGGDAITAMDGWAASTLWPWAENKVRREHPDLGIGTQEQVENGESPFYRKVAEEFENAVARSQSTSDEIHQGILRKSKNPLARAFTLFRSDSAQTYNAIRQMIGEAQYYARSGKDPGKLRAAKRKVGTAVVTAIAGYMWAEVVEFLMNLWKHKGKKYRDDDDELTAQSVMGEMVYGLIGDMAGIVVGGEELYDIIGAVVTDRKWSGINTMGMEQLNDMLEEVIETAKTVVDIISDWKDIQDNGGDLGEYFRRHGNDILGTIKNVAKTVAVYIPGLPANNLEAYLLGPMKWISPELETAYEDLMKTADKNGLSGLEGDALTGRIGSILDNRRISQSEDTAQILAELYATGYKQAVPGDTPTSVSINGESRKLGAYQQQTYDAIWGSVVADALDEMVASDAFTSSDQKTQEKMLSNLYTYAAERAKAELFDDYEMDSAAAKNAEIVKAGASIAECITWNTITSGMKSGEKAAELAAWNIPEKAKRAIFRNKVTDSREDTIAEFQNVGLSFNQFLRAYSKYNEINNLDMKASEKAIEFSRWVNGQGYSAVQSAVVRDQLTYFSMTPASAGRYDELVSAGMDPEDAYTLMSTMNALEPEEGKISVSDIQRWRACVDFSDDANDQLTALSAVMDDTQFEKVKIAYSFGVEPEAYVRLQEIKSGFDKDGNEYLSNNEIKAAIDSMSGLTMKQRAALWQLATGSKSARKNPYDGKVGQQVIDAREKAKESADSGAGTNAAEDDDSFQQAFLNQLLGRG